LGNAGLEVASDLAYIACDLRIVFEECDWQFPDDFVAGAETARGVRAMAASLVAELRLVAHGRSLAVVRDRTCLLRSESDWNFSCRRVRRSALNGHSGRSRSLSRGDADELCGASNLAIVRHP
jgi:hypothetical protein